MIVETIFLKLCLNEMQFEEYKEKHFSDYVIYAEYDSEEQQECFLVKIEKW